MEIRKTYIQNIPKFRFIGKIYRNEDRINGGFGAHWGKAFKSGMMDTIVEAAGGADKIASLYDDGNAHIGLMHDGNGAEFMYAIGKFVPADTPVPNDLDCLDFPAFKLGVCWLYGNESSGELYGHEPDVAIKLGSEGHSLYEDKADRGFWFFERYHLDRYTTPDEKGNVILDVGFLLSD